MIPFFSRSIWSCQFSSVVYGIYSCFNQFFTFDVNSNPSFSRKNKTVNKFNELNHQIQELLKKKVEKSYCETLIFPQQLNEFSLLVNLPQWHLQLIEWVQQEYRRNNVWRKTHSLQPHRPEAVVFVFDQTLSTAKAQRLCFLHKVFIYQVLTVEIVHNFDWNCVCRHILEDPSAPFHLCLFVPPSGQSKCTNVISNTHPRG